MKSLTHRIATFAATLAVAASLSFAQTGVRLNAKIPFTFHTSSGTLPAGVYSVALDSTRSGSNITSLRDASSQHKIYIGGMDKDLTQTGTPAVVFRCDDGGCTLVGVRCSEGTVHYDSGHKNSWNKEIALTSAPARAMKGN